MRLTRHLLATAASINGIRLTATERAMGRLLRGPDGHEEDDLPPARDDDEDEVLELEDEVQPGAPPAEEDDDDAPPPEDEGEDETIITFGDDEAEPQATDSDLVKHLRSEIKRARQEAAEARKTPTAQKVEVGPKPTIEGCAYDEDEYDREMEAWKARKADADRAATATTQASEEQQKLWQTRVAKVAAEKVALGKPDVDDAFENVKAALGEERAASIVFIAEDGNAAKLIYALGKHPTHLAALAAQADPIKFVKDVTKLEGQLKMTVKRRNPPAVDEPARGSAKLSRETKDKKLKKLEEEADRTGDRTALVNYKREMKKAAK